MGNILNTYISKIPANRTLERVPEPNFNYKSEGHVKPMEHKGELLPSKIFGSPVEYAKDIKKDIVNIGKAVKGEGNDHELGRINDLAMKIGSFALAAYLFIKNPLKLNKAMEFVGFGTFFASMALWPKLAIQAPLKARTGVDIHQKYIDSQGRKKMLHQDPQYDLTDLYSREDLDKMGKKLGVSENLPDRDHFIKQRAKKTALQGNTLWMMTAGFATPLMSALACNTLEKPIGKVIEQADIIKSEVALDKAKALSETTTKGGTLVHKLQGLKQKISINKYLSKNSDKIMDDKLISELAAKIGKSANSASLTDAIKQDLSSLKNEVVIDESFVQKALKGKISDGVLSSLTPEQRSSLNQAIKDKSLKNISSVLSKAAGGNARTQINNEKEYFKTLSAAAKKLEKPSVSQVNKQIKGLNKSISEYAAGKKILDNYIDARIGDKSGTYIANQWNRVCDTLIRSLKLNDKELKAVSEGNIDIINEKMTALASKDKNFDKTIRKLMKQINKFEKKTNANFVEKAQSYSSQIHTSSANALNSSGFATVADKISSTSKNRTLENVRNVNLNERISGAQSSFYRLLQSLDLAKKDAKFAKNIQAALKDSEKIKNEQELANLVKTCKDLVKKSDPKDYVQKLQENGLSQSQATAVKDVMLNERVTQRCQKVIMSATSTDHIEKLTTSGFNLSQKEYKQIMDTLLSDSTGSEISSSLTGKMGADKADKMLNGFNAYKKSFRDKFANWQNNMTPELSRRTLDEANEFTNAVEGSKFTGKPIKSMIQDAAKKSYNSKKWLKIFGGAMIVLTVVTLAAGLLIGRKGKTEKEVEEKNKVNG